MNTFNQRELLLYLIEILHQTTTKLAKYAPDVSLYLIEILHQTTTLDSRELRFLRCILSKFYIKPQRRGRQIGTVGVVSYRNSTSNHNQLGLIFSLNEVVSYRNSTSNHNSVSTNMIFHALYLIEILHQTTTVAEITSVTRELYLIEILHQTTTTPPSSLRYQGCILSKFYIKPQRSRASFPWTVRLYLIEILHQTTTRVDALSPDVALYLIEILHQTTTGLPTY